MNYHVILELHILLGVLSFATLLGSYMDRSWRSHMLKATAASAFATVVSGCALAAQTQFSVRSCLSLTAYIVLLGCLYLYQRRTIQLRTAKTT